MSSSPGLDPTLLINDFSFIGEESLVSVGLVVIKNTDLVRQNLYD